jgi:superfamily II DNA or RNA helicase
VGLVQKHQAQAKASGEPYLHNLFYCSPGESELVVQKLHQIGLKVHKFVCEVPLKERGKILKAFEAGDLEGIVAIKCLDEGVDIPATKRAYILASTSNPREFIQRRGRILRRHSGKYTADLYDFVVGPWGRSNQYDDDIAKSLLRRELPRIVEFNSLSETKHTATKEIYEVCNYYGMGDLLYLEPWELYKRINNQELDPSRSGA